jgi:F0F1-type ATP synthase assembly protein I
VLAPKRRGRNPNWAGADQGWTAACTLVAGICVWGAIGAFLDHVFGTWPVLFAVGAFLGNFAAIYLIYVQHFRDAPTSVRFEFPGEKTDAA